MGACGRLGGFQIEGKGRASNGGGGEWEQEGGGRQGIMWVCGQSDECGRGKSSLIKQLVSRQRAIKVQGMVFQKRELKWERRRRSQE